MGFRLHNLFALLMLIVASHAMAEQPADEGKARANLAEKLLNLSRSLDMKEASYTDSKGGGKDYNSNDGNSFTSNTTYHSYVWDYCLRWVGNRNCGRWLDPYVSPHGNQGDRSPLEGAVYEEWQKRKPEGEIPDPPQNGGNFQYAIWNIKRDPNAQTGPLTTDGRLNKEGVIDMRLIPEVQTKVEQVGTDTAQRQINLTYDQNGGMEAGTMPNMESLRMMAGRWTKMMRNRLVANIGEARAADVPVEIGLGEDYADCNNYAQAVQNEYDETDEKRKSQAPLDLETKNRRLEDRIALCNRLKQAPVWAVNPVVGPDGETVEEGDKELEAVDKWRARVNVALIDSVGKDPNSIPKPNNAPIARYEYESDIPDYEAGGRAKRIDRKTNADQIAGYNRNLQDAAVGMKNVAARTGGRDNSEAVLNYQIALESRNLIEINGITGEMRNELNSTNFSQTSSGSLEAARRPEKQLETAPSQLTVRRTQ